jgi:hypothetical protein
MDDPRRRWLAIAMHRRWIDISLYTPLDRIERPYTCFFHGIVYASAVYISDIYITSGAYLWRERRSSYIRIVDLGKTHRDLDLRHGCTKTKKPNPELRRPVRSLCSRSANARDLRRGVTADVLRDVGAFAVQCAGHCLGVVWLVGIAAGIVMVLDVNAIASFADLEGFREFHLDTSRSAVAADVGCALVASFAPGSGECRDRETAPLLKGARR